MTRKPRVLIVLLVLAGATWAAVQAPNGLAGDWQGSLQAGKIKLRVAMHLGNDK